MPGYKKIIINPHLSDSLTYAKAEYHSIYGKVLSSWKREGKSISLDVEIPPNTTANVVLPTDKKENIFESGKPVESSKIISMNKAGQEKITLKIGSGKYHFEVR